MSVAVKEGYVNPLTMMGQKKNSLTLTEKLPAQRGKDQVQELQLKQQTLQNQILMLKSTTNGAASGETQKVVEKQLEEVKTQLNSAKAEPTEAVRVQEQRAVPHKQNFDTYEKETKDQRAPGLYQLQQEAEKGYEIKFVPFSG